MPSFAPDILLPPQATQASGGRPSTLPVANGPLAFATHWAARLARPALSWVVVASVLSACGLPQAPAPKADFDLGPLPTAQAPSPLTGPRFLQLAITSAPPALGSHEVRYRLLYAQALQPRAYTLARWSMPPAQLVHQRLRRQLAADGWLLGTSTDASTPVLHIELDAFEQVFDAPDRSHGLVQWQVSLRQGASTLAQRTIEAQANATSADAAGGAQALAVATDDAMAQLRNWLAQYALQRASLTTKP